MFSIGQLARHTGCKVQTIRYYEQIGLLPEPERSEGNQRRYNQRHQQRLSFIRHSRELGFPLDDIRQLLSLSDQPQSECHAVDAIARKHLQRIQTRLDRLQSLKRELSRMVEKGDHGLVRDCRIIEVLADHDHCLEEHGDALSP